MVPQKVKRLARSWVFKSVPQTQLVIPDTWSWALKEVILEYLRSLLPRANWTDKRFVPSQQQARVRFLERPAQQNLGWHVVATSGNADHPKASAEIHQPKFRTPVASALPTYIFSKLPSLALGNASFI